MTLLYLMRHGETELNTKGVYYGWTDCGLSEKGVKQAQKVALMLKDIKFDTVISSPLKRAKDTAAIVSKFPPEEIVLDGRLKELNFGSWEGRHYQSIQEWDRENWDLWVNNWKEAAPPGGESFMDMYRRVEESVKEILEKYSGQTLLVVTHQGCLRMIMSILLNLDYDGYWHFTFAHGTYSLLEIKHGLCVVQNIN